MNFAIDGKPTSLERDITRCVGLLCALSPVGAVVAVATEDERAMAVLALATLRAGRTLLPLDPRAPGPEVAPALSLAQLAFLDPAPASRWGYPGPTLRIEPPPTGSLFARMLGRSKAPTMSFPAILRDHPETPDQPPDPQSVAVYLRTSGTSGGPKLVPWTRAALAAQLPVLCRGLQVDASSRVLNLLPAFHIDGLVMGIYLCAHAGAALLRLPRSQALDVRAAADLIFRERGTHLVAVPAVLGLLLRLGEDIAAVFGEPSFRAFVSTAAPLPDPTWRRIQQGSGRPVVNVYGLTETGNLFFAGPDPQTGRIGTVGRSDGCETRLIDEAGDACPPGQPGELLLRGPTVVQAFQDGTPATTPDGWFATGDLAIQDEDGLWRILGRVRGLLSVGGLKVAPMEVEQALLEIDGVSDARVFAVPDPTWGERVVAELVAEGLDEARILAALRERLSEHKIPRELRWTGGIQRGPTGKVALLTPQGHTTDDRVLALAARVFRTSASSLSQASRIERVPGWDSIGHLDLIAALEKEFGVVLGLQDMMDIRTLADAARVVELRGPVP